ncbi:MAG TPA: RdgB/HAM1 family non-canonical purine NTP pyrophosphatase [Pyrinomonadaceae bacterium]|jgi:XTP/dITP diphosphohydrolase|nr:RdgB/HAM1 family non-canonical purine NTP pyrophosphatase [Pyrinomonadaceae bacterium]
MNAAPELLIATRNAGKVREFASLLAGAPLRIRGLEEFPQTTEVEETGRTFAENASLKARVYSAQTGLWTLADDSGLEVEALGGAPGIFSARYGGPHATTDAERTARLLSELAQTKDDARRARFVCVIALARPHADAPELFTGECTGRIAHAPRGMNGFGYDPVFMPDGYEQTFGELSSEIKHDLSHRARALRGALAFIFRQLEEARLDPPPPAR